MYFQKCEGDPLKLPNPMDAKDNTSLLVLRKRLEELNLFKQLRTFQFWDVEECCRIDGDFEALNSIRNYIHLIPTDSYSDVNCNKRPRLGNVGESVGIRNDVGNIVQLEPTTREPESTEIRLTDPMSTMKVATLEEHSCTNGEVLKSTLLLKDVL